eukprot:CAMPEP_0196220766 /NCGR_PEP_ID=MMETSP0912-20130531/41335_1 /TAXON_ID=49265 /ORGANISM="Thalassiosira rotula, Strain GSO102" /LENGTH=77 /DNA_ID=CAMNT_0041499075 /DNA_START=14 /DNA_END=244 /DNA_ORIENTATION=-
MCNTHSSFVDITRPQGDQHISIHQCIPDDAMRRRNRSNVPRRRFPMLRHGIHYRLPRDAGDRILARRVDICDVNNIG